MEFQLRKWQSGDAESFFQYAVNRKITDSMRNSFPSNLEQVQKLVDWFSDSDEKQQYCRAIEIDGKAVGCVGIFIKEDVYRKSADIAYWLGETFWGKGIMTCAVRQMCETAFEQYDIVRISAEPYEYNIGSRRVLEHAGFELEGILRKSVYKNGQIYDSCMYALVKR